MPMDIGGALAASSVSSTTMSAQNDAGPTECLPLAVVEVVPLHLPTPPRSSDACSSPSNDRSMTREDISSLHLGPPPPPLSAPMVKIQLRRLTAASMMTNSMSSSGGAGGSTMRILLDRDGNEVDNGTDDDLNQRMKSISLDAGTTRRSTEDSEHLNEKMKSLSLHTDSPSTSTVQTYPATIQVVGGNMFLSNAKWKGANEKHQPKQEGEVPIIRLLSDDPTDHSDGVPCWVRGYAQVASTASDVTKSRAENINCSHEALDCAVMNGTLVRILPSIPARLVCGSDSGNDDKENTTTSDLEETTLVTPTTTYEGHPRTECGVPLPLPLFTELSGEVDTHQLNVSNNDNAVNESEFILACHDDETVRALLVRMKALLDTQVFVGTTEDAIAIWEAKQLRGQRRRRALEAYISKKQKQPIPSPSNELAAQPSSFKDVDSCSNLFRDGALTVHNQFEASGKTMLVQTVARHVLGCSAVHTFNATTLFAKYGANGADAALESLLHSIILSAAVGGGRIVPGKKRDETASPPSICIILDNLVSFVPPSMAGMGRSIGDPALPALNSMVAYLTKVTDSIKNQGQFPFPAKNPMYNLSGSKGYAMPVRICIVGIITCDDDGGRKGIDAPGDSYTVLDVLGSNRYRLPQPSSKTRYQAFRRAFEEARIQLSADALAELPVIAASTTSARGREFRKVAKHLSSNLVDKYTGKARDATAFDVREAMKIVSRDAPKDTSIGVTFLSNKTGGGSLSTQSLSKGGDMFASVGGNSEAKVALEDALALDPKKRRILSAFGLSPPTGVLLYGAPGTGKTLLAKATALALESESPIGGAFINLRATDIVRGEVGRSEKLVVSCFELARANTPAVVFIDEFQSLFTERGGTGSSQLASTLLQCMDDVSRWRNADALVEKHQENEEDIFDVGKGRIIVLGATNVPWMIDKAFLRPGRFDRVVHVGLPNLEERESILGVHVGSMHIFESEGMKGRKGELCKRMAEETEGFSGADLFALCRMAVIRCINDKTSTVEDGVKEHHFVDALKRDVFPSCSEEFVRKLLRWSPRGNNSAMQH